MDILLQRIVDAGELYTTCREISHVKQAAAPDQPHSLSNPWLLPVLGAGAGALVGGLATRARRGESARERARRVITNALGIGAVGGVGGFALGGLSKSLQEKTEKAPPGLLSSRAVRLGLAGATRGVTGLINRGGHIARHNALLGLGDPKAAESLKIQDAKISLGGASADSRIQQNLSTIRSALNGTAAQKQNVAKLMGEAAGTPLNSPSLTRQLNALGVYNPHAPRAGQYFRRLGYGLERIVGGGGRNLTYAGAGPARLLRGGGSTAAMLAAYHTPTVIGNVVGSLKQPARDAWFDYLSVMPVDKPKAPPSLTGWLFNGANDNTLREAVTGKEDAGIWDTIKSVVPGI